jgi:hypothetical protein
VGLNLLWGQGGFLLTAIMGGGLLLLARQPVTAGLLFSLLLSYKPHLGLLIPLALMAGRQWRALAGMAGAGILLVMASAFVFGPDIWLDWWRNLAFAAFQLQHGFELWPKMPTLAGAILLLGGGLTRALAAQGAVAVVVALVVMHVWRRDATPACKGSVLVLASLLASPHALSYDLVLLALPMAWVGREAVGRGLRPGQWYFLFFMWFSPLLTSFLATRLGLQTAPLLLGAFLVAAMHWLAGARHPDNS